MEAAARAGCNGMLGRKARNAELAFGERAISIGDGSGIYPCLPEQAFLYVGSIDEAVQKAEKLKA